MKKGIGKFKVSYLLSFLFVLLALFAVSAQEEPGKITLSKSATKVYDQVENDNLYKGRKAKVTLEVAANPYKKDISESKKADILFVLDASGSMNKDFNGKDTSITANRRITSVKKEVNTIIDELLNSNNNDNIRLGFVEYASKDFDTLNLTSNATSAHNFINNSYGVQSGNYAGTNYQAAFRSARTVLNNSGRADAEQIVIMLTDGIPTIYNFSGSSSNASYCGNGNKDENGTTGRATGCTMKPSEAGKIELDNLTNAYNKANIFTITYGNESEAAQILERINPTAVNPTRQNLKTLSADDLRSIFEKIIHQTITTISSDAKVVDIIPSDFKLSEKSISELQKQGVIIKENSDGTTTLTWPINVLDSENDYALSYEVVAKDEYHGSMYTNDSATLTATIDADNPYYDGTKVSLDFDMPSVEIPAITNDDHYKDNSSYEAYEGTIINGTTILANDLNKIIEKENSSVSNVTVLDTIVIVENENVVKTSNGYEIYKNGTLQGLLNMNQDGTFTFTPSEGVTGEVEFTYYITTNINPNKETSNVYSNVSKVTLNILERSKININGSKTWNDNNNQDGVRPESITINLFADGKKIDETTTNANKNWKYSFTNLPEYELGYEKERKITYSVTENRVSNYTTSVNGYNITNTHTPEVTSINGSKVWNDNNNQDGVRPESVTINLLANGKEVKEVTVTANSNWEYSFSNLPVYENGKKITYSVTEDAVKGYSTSINGYDVTNTHNPSKVNINGSKTWADNNNQDGIRPRSININLFANGEIIDSTSVTADDNWEYSFDNLDEYKNGEKIIYSVLEDNVKGYEAEYNNFDITNTHSPEKINLSGEKIWLDNDNQDGVRPDSITVNLLANGVIIDSALVTADDNWKYGFDNLDKYKDGKEIKYTISENEVANYTSLINGYDITNTHNPEKISISGTKTWNDNDNQDGIRPDNIIVELLANGEVIKETSVTANDNWKYSFDNLDKYKDGKEISYTILEVEVSDYTTSIDGYDITNTHTPEVTTINGSKVWNDNNNQDGVRPESINVTLTGIVNDKAVYYDTKKVSVDDDWKYSFEKLPVYNNGSKITYSVTEDAVKGYEASINGYDITNTHTPEVTTINGSKVWNDNNNQDGVRPESVTINLLANGKEVKEVTVNANSNWEYSFSNLPVYENGKKITYSVTEDAVKGYSTSINGYDVTNTHTPSTINIEGEKVWADNNNQDGVRPESVTVNLLANGKEVKEVTVNANSNWKYNFNNLPEYENGNKINYTVTEDKVADYEMSYDENNKFIIVNTHNPSKIEVSGKKTWKDNNNQDGIRPRSINVTLTGKVGDDVIYTSSKEVTANDNWKYSFANLDEYNDGKVIVYSVTEDAVKGYSTEYDNYDITNTHTPEKISINGTKTWDDSDDQDGKRPRDIRINLLANGEVVDYTTASIDSNWKYSFDNLDKYKDGKEIKYTITEVLVDGYATKITDFDITNIHTPETISYYVEKTWDDYDNNDGIRPNEITVRLYANGNLIDTVSISSSNNWTYNFTNLPKYNQGVLVDYEITEDAVKGYETSIVNSITDNNGNLNSVITNKHDLEKTEINIEKIWDDYHNKYGTRPNSIMVDLFANGEKYGRYNITDAMKWRLLIEGLNKYKNGELINYYIKEVPVLKYTTTYDGYTIKNKYTYVPTKKKAKEEIIPPYTGLVEEDNNLLLVFALLAGVTSTFAFIKLEEF